MFEAIAKWRWCGVAAPSLILDAFALLNRRIPTQEIIKNEIAAWEEARNQENTTVSWQFTTSNARVKLNKLYPKIEQEDDNCKNSSQSINSEALRPSGV